VIVDKADKILMKQKFEEIGAHEVDNSQMIKVTEGHILRILTQMTKK